MKKSYFITGAVYLAFGCLMLTVALFTGSRLEGSFSLLLERWASYNRADRFFCF